jgi:hypothetical protein
MPPHTAETGAAGHGGVDAIEGTRTGPGKPPRVVFFTDSFFHAGLTAR